MRGWRLSLNAPSMGGGMLRPRGWVSVTCTLCLYLCGVCSAVLYQCMRLPLHCTESEAARVCAVERNARTLPRFAGRRGELTWLACVAEGEEKRHCDVRS